MNYKGVGVVTVWVSVDEWWLVCLSHCSSIWVWITNMCECEQVLRQVCSSLRCANICSPQLLRVRCQFSQPAPFTQEAQRKIWWNVARGRMRVMLSQLRLWGEGSKHHCKQLRLCPLDVIGLRKLYATWKAIWWRPKETGNREEHNHTLTWIYSKVDQRPWR